MICTRGPSHYSEERRKQPSPLLFSILSDLFLLSLTFHTKSFQTHQTPCFFLSSPSLPACLTLLPPSLSPSCVFFARLPCRLSSPSPPLSHDEVGEGSDTVYSGGGGVGAPYPHSPARSLSPRRLPAPHPRRHCPRLPPALPGAGAPNPSPRARLFLCLRGSWWVWKDEEGKKGVVPISKCFLGAFPIFQRSFSLSLSLPSLPALLFLARSLFRACIKCMGEGRKKEDDLTCEKGNDVPCHKKSLL